MGINLNSPRQYGTSDGAPPERYTHEQLSRVHDAIESIKWIDTYCDITALSAFWDALPYALKFELNYAKWMYVKVQ